MNRLNKEKKKREREFKAWRHFPCAKSPKYMEGRVPLTESISSSTNPEQETTSGLKSNTYILRKMNGAYFS